MWPNNCFHQIRESIALVPIQFLVLHSVAYHGDGLLFSVVGHSVDVHALR